jgi:hypothetical protein
MMIEMRNLEIKYQNCNTEYKSIISNMESEKSMMTNNDEYDLIKIQDLELELLNKNTEINDNIDTIQYLNNQIEIYTKSNELYENRISIQNEESVYLIKHIKELDICLDKAEV